MTDMIREAVWYSPFPLVGIRSVITKRFWKFVKIVYRDYDGTCGSTWCLDTKDVFVPREV